MSNLLHQYEKKEKGRGLIRPQIGPSNFFQDTALETIQINRAQQGEHFGAIFDIL